MVYISWLFISIIIAVVFYLSKLNKSFFGFGAERKYKEVLKLLQENLKKSQQISIGGEIAEEYRKEITSAINRLEAMHDNFLRLQEKYKHASINQKRKISNDWLT
jgi:hypothetical protein